MAIEVKPPAAWRKDKFTVFLAGAIDGGTAAPWQRYVAEHLAAYDIVILNPLRDDWDSSWDQSIENPQFREQVAWEQRGLREADFRVFVFLDDSKAPITLLELGENLDQPGAVCCEPNYYRKGNVDITCALNNMPVFESLNGMIVHLQTILDENGLRLKPGKKASKVPEDRGYVYHGTGRQFLPNIAKRGLLPRKPDNEGWPEFDQDGPRSEWDEEVDPAAFEPRLFATESLHLAEQYAENYEEIFPAKKAAAHSQLRSALESLRPQMAAAAQKVYDEWTPEEDDDFGGGGICDEVARELSGVIVQGVPDVEIEDGGQDGDDHAWVIVGKDGEACGVDIAPGVYETGGGYNWTKIPGVTIEPGGIDIFPLRYQDAFGEKTAAAKTAAIDGWLNRTAPGSYRGEFEGHDIEIYRATYRGPQGGSPYGWTLKVDGRPTNDGLPSLRSAIGLLKRDYAAVPAASEIVVDEGTPETPKVAASDDPILVVVHPGSACGSADFNLGSRLNGDAARDGLRHEFDGWRGGVIVLSGTLDDELPNYPALNTALDGLLERAKAAGKVAIRARAEDPAQASVIKRLLGNPKNRGSEYVVTGAWLYDKEQGCVGDVIQAIRSLGFPVMVSDMAITDESFGEEASDKTAASNYDAESDEDFGRTQGPGGGMKKAEDQVPDEWRGINIVPDSRYSEPIQFVPIERTIRSDELVSSRSRKVREGMRQPNPTFTAVSLRPAETASGEDDISSHPDKSKVVRWQAGDHRIWDGNHRHEWAKRNGFRTLPVQILELGRKQASSNVSQGPQGFDLNNFREKLKEAGYGAVAFRDPHANGRAAIAVFDTGKLAIAPGAKKAAASQEEMINEAKAWQNACFSPGDPGYVDPRTLHWVDERRFDLHKIDKWDSGWFDDLDAEHKETLLERGWPKNKVRPYLEAFRKAIQKGTIEEPIVVQGTDGKFYVWEGNHRMGAAHVLGVTTMPCWVGYRAEETKVASPDFGYSKFNDREQDLKKLEFRVEGETGFGGLASIVAEAPAEMYPYRQIPAGSKALVGYIEIGEGPDGPESASVYDVNVDDDWRGTGLGQMLYEKALALARKRGAISLSSSTDMQPESRKAWLRLSKRYPVRMVKDPEATYGRRWVLDITKAAAKTEGDDGLDEEDTESGHSPKLSKEAGVSVSALGRAVKRFCLSDESYALLDSITTDADTWTAGGCWILADAVRKGFGGELYSVWGTPLSDRNPASEPRPQHVLVKIDGLFIDADGASNEASLLRRWTELEGIRDAAVRPITTERLEQTDFPRPKEAEPVIEGIQAKLGTKRAATVDDKWLDITPYFKAKTAYISPKNAQITVAFDLSTRPSVTLMIDLGIPNFTVFALTFPIDGLTTNDLVLYTADALEALLDEVAAFMLSLKYSEDAVARIFSLTRECFKSIDFKDASDSAMPDKDDKVRMYEGQFEIPAEFVDETQERVILAARVAEGPAQDQDWMGKPGDITETPAFKAWFAGSKVVDDHGRPLRVYHGTGTEFGEFGHSGYGDGMIFFTDDPALANDIAMNRFEVQRENGSEDPRAIVVPCFLRVRKPFDPRNPEHGKWMLEHGSDPVDEPGFGAYDFFDDPMVVREIRGMGFDGIWMKESDGKYDTIAVFSPDQIKSAIGNNGSFDPESASITAGKAIKRMPNVRHLQLTRMKPSKPNSPARIIQLYRDRALRSLPRPHYVLVYDRNGRGVGAISLARDWEKRLLRRM